jgi:predicted Zn-dependent protease
MATQLPVRAALAAVCVAGVIACAVTYVADVRLHDALAEFGRTRNFNRALRELRASQSALNPQVGRDVGIAYAQLATGHPAQAERAIAAATRREPGNTRAWIELTRIQLARGRLTAARASWARARQLDPHVQRALPPKAASR